MADQKQPETKEVPQYKLTEAAYIDDKLLESGAKIEYRGAPGHHMEPLNEAARAMKKAHGKKFVDPIEAMTVVA